MATATDLRAVAHVEEGVRHVGENLLARNKDLGDTNEPHQKFHRTISIKSPQDDTTAKEPSNNPSNQLLALTLPLVGAKSAVIRFMAVVFPAPFGPSRPSTWPRFTVSESWSTATCESMCNPESSVCNNECNEVADFETNFPPG